MVYILLIEVQNVGLLIYFPSGGVKSYIFYLTETLLKK